MPDTVLEAWNAQAIKTDPVPASVESIHKKRSKCDDGGRVSAESGSRAVTHSSGGRRGGAVRFGYTVVSLGDWGLAVPWGAVSGPSFRSLASHFYTFHYGHLFLFRGSWMPLVIC